MFSVGALALVASLLAVLQAPPGLSAVEAGQYSTAGRRVLVVIVDRISIDDIVDADLPGIRGLASRGSAALMNARVRYDSYGTGSYVILGAGGRALAVDNAGLAYNTEEMFQAGEESVEAGSIYLSRTGREAPAGSVVNLYIEEMRKKSDSSLATSVPGLLGETLLKAGKRVAVFGNADSLGPSIRLEGPVGAALPEFPQPVEPGRTSSGHPLSRTWHREISCIAMDASGLVPEGDASTRLDRPSSGPGLLSTDFELLVDIAAAGMRSADLVVVDMGQTSRVDDQSSLYSEGELVEARRAALAECDRALSALLESVDLSRDLVLICTPTPTRKMMIDGDLLTPLIAAGPGLSAGGSLSSPTTRRTGLISNFDIAPTILEHLGVEAPPEMDGRAVRSEGSGLRLETLVSLRDRSVYATGARAALVKLFAISGLVVLLVLILLSLVRRELIFDHPLFWSVVLLSLLSAPVIYALVPLLPVRVLGWSITALVVGELAAGAASLLVFYAVARLKKRRRGDKPTGGGEPGGALGWAVPRAVLLLAGLALACVIADTFAGSPASAVSPFGTSLVMGSRYYGIGNIYMGVALGAAVLAACLAPDVFPSFIKGKTAAMLFAGGVLLVTVAVLGYPRLGANVGGLITGVAAASVTMIKLKGERLGWKQAGLIALVVVACLVLLLAVDALLPGSSSHAGKTASRISGRGISDAFSVIARKLQANYSLAFASIWRLFFLAGAITALLWRWSMGMFRTVDRAYPNMAAAWTGMVVAMVVALLFNDTGIEAAGAVMIYFILPVILLMLSVARDETSRGGAVREAS